MNIIKRAAGRSRYSIPTTHYTLYDRHKRQISLRCRVPPSGMLLV